MCSVTVTGVENAAASVTATFDGDAKHTGSSGSATLTVTNVAPSNVQLQVSSATLVENNSTMLTGSFADAGTTDTHTVTINWGDGTAATTISLGAGALSFSASHQYLDDNPTATATDLNTVAVTVTDDEDDSGGGNTNLTVNNAAPAIGSVTGGPSEPQVIGSSVAFTVNFTDVGTQDAHTCRFTWDDGQTTTVSPTGTGDGSCAATHAYLMPGVYTVQFQVSDDDTGTVDTRFEFVVIYDPSGAFVTGGGWIVSPTGAYVANPSLTGRANFGFVSKYQRGANVPTGQTEFQFQVGNLNFHSSEYQWLVVAGAKAQYKGSGTINGTGNYGFMVTAADGAISGGGGTDKFRIKIWNTSTGATVYDNVVGASDDIDSASPQIISGGSIVIHD
jgi:hypothetical protein